MFVILFISLISILNLLSGMFALQFDVPVGMLTLPNNVHTHFGMPVSKFIVPIGKCGKFNLPIGILSLHLLVYA